MAEPDDGEWPRGRHARRARAGERSGDGERDRHSRRSTRAAQVENTLRPTSRRARAGGTSEPERRAAERESTAADDRAASRRPDRTAVPEEVRRRFRERRGTYYFPDGAPAFTDRGRRLTTPSENTEVIGSLVAIAQARGWQDVTVSGTERFRQAAWLAARAAGLTVRGYAATAGDEERVKRAVAAPRAGGPDAASVRMPADAGEVSRRRSDSRDGALLTGRLLEHGAAPYLNDARRARSYYVRLTTPDGERTVWGVDLERALKESLSRPQIGDRVGLRAVRREPVTVREPERDAAGRVVGARERGAERTRWRVETREFLAQRATAARVVRDAAITAKAAVQRHPELLGTYLQVKAAELAAKKLRDPADRAAFVARVRSSLADAVERGEPLTPVRLKEPARARPAPEREPRERAAARS
jgi:hypothetical protein